MKLFPIETISGSASECADELLDVVPTIMRAIRSHMREAGSVELSVPQFRTLRYLSVHRNCSLSDVAEHVGVALPSMSKIVQLLLTRGYVDRQIDPADRRRQMLAPTAKGARVLKASREATRNFLADSIIGLGASERHSIMTAMRSLRVAFTKAGTMLPEAADSLPSQRGSVRRRGT